MVQEEIQGTRSPAATMPQPPCRPFWFSSLQDCTTYHGKTARLTTPQRVIHSASRPGTGSLKMAASPRPSGSSDFRGQARILQMMKWLVRS